MLIATFIDRFILWHFKPFLRSSGFFRYGFFDDLHLCIKKNINLHFWFVHKRGGENRYDFEAIIDCNNSFKWPLDTKCMQFNLVINELSTTNNNHITTEPVLDETIFLTKQSLKMGYPKVRIPNSTVTWDITPLYTDNIAAKEYNWYCCISSLKFIKYKLPSTFNVKFNYTFNNNENIRYSSSYNNQKVQRILRDSFNESIKENDQALLWQIKCTKTCSRWGNVTICGGDTSELPAITALQMRFKVTDNTGKQKNFFNRVSDITSSNKLLFKIPFNVNTYHLNINLKISLIAIYDGFQEIHKDQWKKYGILL